MNGNTSKLDRGLLNVSYVGKLIFDKIYWMRTCALTGVLSHLFAMNVDCSLLTSLTGNVMWQNILVRVISAVQDVINDFPGDIILPIILKRTLGRNPIHVEFAERLQQQDRTTTVI